MTTQMACMKLAVRNRITNNVVPNLSTSGSSRAASCELSPDGRPFSHSGLVFFSVHGGERRNVAGTESYFRNEMYFFNVTVSLRSAHVAKIRIGDKVMSGDDAVEYLTDLAIVALDGYLDLADDANTLLLAEYPDNDHQPFIDGVRPVYLGSEEPRIRTPAWWDAKASDTGTQAGISQTSRFQGLQLIREIGQA